MARWQRGGTPPPAGIGFYDPAVWGPGEAGIRAWGRAARAWLMEDEANRVMPFGETGSTLDVIREVVRLLKVEWFGAGEA